MNLLTSIKDKHITAKINETVYTDSVDAPDIGVFKVSNVTETSVDIEYQIRGDNLDEYYIELSGQTII